MFICHCMNTKECHCIVIAVHSSTYKQNKLTSSAYFVYRGATIQCIELKDHTHTGETFEYSVNFIFFCNIIQIVKLS